MQIQSMRGMVLFVAAFLSFSAQAGLAPRESVTLQAIAKSCSDHQRKFDDFMRRHPTNSPYSDAMVAEAFALLKQPSILPASYWTMRARANSLSIRNVATARDFSAMDGRLGHAELTCSGHVDSLAWRLITDKAIAARKADANFRKRIAAAWRTWLIPQLGQPMSYAQYTNIVDTANRLAKRRLMTVPRSISDSVPQMDAKIRQAAPAKPMPLISNHQDPKWIDWAKMSQTKSRKERELIPSAQKSLSALAK